MRHLSAISIPPTLFRLLSVLSFIVLSHLPIASETVEQLLSRYANAGHSRKYALAKELCDTFQSNDVFFTPPQPVNPSMPPDTLDALVY